MKTEDVYMAGFFDGEGYIGLLKRWHKTRGKRYLEYAVHLSIGQNDGAIMDWVYKTYGGHLHRVKRDGSFYWITTNKNALAVLKRIEPYLKYKRRQALLAISFYEGVAQGHKMNEQEIERRESLYLQLRAEKKIFTPSTYCKQRTGATTKRTDLIKEDVIV